MNPLFTIQASNTHQSLLLQDSSSWESIRAKINRSSMVGEWCPPLFDFLQIDKKMVNVPDICTVYISGALAFRAELKERLFPVPSANLEFLPLTVSGKPWLLLNCLQAASSINPERSEVMRGINGEIFFVIKIRVTDPDARYWEVFTLADSNRAQLFVTDAFRGRVQKHKLKGITFQAVGEIA